MGQKPAQEQGLPCSPLHPQGNHSVCPIPGTEERLAGGGPRRDAFNTAGYPASEWSKWASDLFPKSFLLFLIIPRRPSPPLEFYEETLPWIP